MGIERSSIERSSVERSTDKTEELPCWRADRSEEDAMGVERRAKSVWTGTLTEGEGKVTGESSGLFTDLPVTWVSRTEDPGGKTSPEELLAAVHRFARTR